jgi:hypothetical protein
VSDHSLLAIVVVLLFITRADFLFHRRDRFDITEAAVCVLTATIFGIAFVLEVVA